MFYAYCSRTVNVFLSGTSSDFFDKKKKKYPWTYFSSTTFCGWKNISIGRFIRTRNNVCLAEAQKQYRARSDYPIRIFARFPTRRTRNHIKSKIPISVTSKTPLMQRL